MYVYSTDITRILISPYNIQQVFTTVNFIWIKHQKFQHIKFLSSQIDFFSGDEHTSAFTVHAEIANFDALCLFFLIVIASCTAHNRFDTCLDFQDIEGFGDIIIRTDIPPIQGTDLDGNEVVRHSSDEEPFSALAFKIMADPFVGKLAFFRVYSGTMNSGSYVYNSTKDKKERVGRILQMHANKRAELDKVYSGDIAAAVGFKVKTTGDTICDEQHPVILESMEFPEPVIELAIEPKTKASQGKLGESLAKLAEEDPTFRAHTNQETGQTIIAGMGELHLEIIVDRLLREFKVEANVGAPQVAYKESITKAVDIDSKYAKQSGGRGQYGHCKVKFEPMDVNGEEVYKFESTVVGGAIPKEYIPAVGEGIEEAMKSGILGGFPVVGVHANVYDGSYHEVDSNEMAFHIAGSLAFKDAMKQASPVLLEPIMKVEVTMPEEYMGDIIGDINSRRGRIEGMDDLGGGKIVRAFVPLSEMFGYSTDLRSRTQGRGNYSMFFESYEQVPKSVQEKVLSNKNA